jgi:polyphosphate glucokinase
VALSCGIDIGGSGIKGALVDLETGELTTERLKIATPQPSTPESVAKVVADLVGQLEWHGPIGCTFPAAVTHGVARSAANVDHSWIGTDIEEVVGAAVGAPVIALNDADAAGVAEVAFGAAAGHQGLVIVVTLGTGIGTALIHGGVLVPNAELGHLEIDGHDAELYASAGARDRDRMSWGTWSGHLSKYLHRLEDLLWPDLLVIGGGVSRKSHKFLPFLELRTPVVPAELRNAAGIVGSAMAASQDRQAPAAG